MKIMNEEKIILSFKNNFSVHLKLKDGSFRNGLVKSINNDFFIFQDRINRVEPIFFLELWDVEPFLENKKEVENGK